MPNRFGKKKWAQRPSCYRWSHLSYTSNPYAQRLRDYSDFWPERKARPRKISPKRRLCEAFATRAAVANAVLAQSAATRTIALLRRTRAAARTAFGAIAVRIAAALAGAALVRARAA
ncbi:hypothetical protein ACX841_26900, partial [Burkholderia pseudomallei]